MLPQLTDNEARVIGCLLEKSVTTPDAYPLTLNALTNACNQKSGRSPVMSLSPGEVQQAVRSLEGKHLVVTDENFKSRAEKYTHRFCNTRYSSLQLSAEQYAIVCLLLLRGAQTPGELRARSGRLHSFADNGEVIIALNELMASEPEAMVTKLPRTPGRKDSEYMHLFSGEVDVSAYEAAAKAEKSSSPGSGSSALQALEERVSQLEQQVAELTARLGE